MVCDSTARPGAWLIHNGDSLHLQHGPIDLVLMATGNRSAIQTAYQQAHQAFESVLSTLVQELPELRSPVDCLYQQQVKLLGPVAKRMMAVTRPFRDQFVTPMAAVAGAVADHVMHAALSDNPLRKLMVNNGGDIAIHLGPNQSARVGICKRPIDQMHADILTIHTSDRIGGVATSGWQGRSHSLGVADAVTVLAADAASADVAATLIANRVTVEESVNVERCPANTLQPDSDLGETLVTVAVSQLSDNEREIAMLSGIDYAQQLLCSGLIAAAYIHLQGKTAIVVDKQPDALMSIDKQMMVCSSEEVRQWA